MTSEMEGREPVTRLPDDLSEEQALEVAQLRWGPSLRLERVRHQDASKRFRVVSTLVGALDQGRAVLSVGYVGDAPPPATLERHASTVVIGTGRNWARALETATQVLKLRATMLQVVEQLRAELVVDADSRKGIIFAEVEKSIQATPEVKARALELLGQALDTMIASERG